MDENQLPYEKGLFEDGEWERLYKDNFAIWLKMVTKLGLDNEKAEDLIQELLVKLWTGEKKIRSFKGGKTKCPTPQNKMSYFLALRQIDATHTAKMPQ